MKKLIVKFLNGLLLKKKAKAMPSYEKEFVDEQLEIGLAGGSKL